MNALSRRLLRLMVIVSVCLLPVGCEEEYEDWKASLDPHEAPGFMCGRDVAMIKVVPEHFIDWSPDGTHLIFDDVTSVRVVDVNGRRLRHVANANPGYQFPNDLGMHAAFSPDGQRIVYTSCEYPTEGLRVHRDAPWTPRGEYQYEIATIALDGSGAQRRTTNGYYDHLPVWSAGGQYIAFLSARSQNSGRTLDQLRIVHATDVEGEPESLVGGLYTGAPPRWSPDSDYLAVLAFEREADIGRPISIRVSSLVVVAADGSSLRKVAESVSTVSWAPDSRRLAFARLRDGDVQLATIAPDGSDERVVKRLTYEEILPASDVVEVDAPYPAHRLFSVPRLHVAWSPGGSHLLYSCGHQFCVVTLDGELVGQTPKEFAKERGRAVAAWAPDGSRIAVRAAGNPTPNGEVVLYTMAPDGSDVRVLVRGGLAMVAEHSGYADASVGKTACRDGYVVANPNLNPRLVADCEVLMRLRDTLAGPTLLNWGAGTPLAQWAGVQVSGEPRRVTGLKFRLWEGVHRHDSHQLIGRLPPALSDLDQLQTLDLAGHTFFDDIPRQLEHLAHLRELDLRLHGGVWMSGCLSAGFLEQLESAEGVRVCGQEGGP